MPVEAKAVGGGSDRRHYKWAATVAIAVVVAGFARMYFLKTGFGAPALATLAHVHGLAMTLGFATFLMRVRLVAMWRTDLPAAAKLGRSPGPQPRIMRLSSSPPA